MADFVLSISSSSILFTDHSVPSGESNGAMVHITQFSLLLLCMLAHAVLSLKSTLLQPTQPIDCLVLKERNLRKMHWQEGGHKVWKWKGHAINYIAPDVFGEDALTSNKPPLLLIHGFGASSFHWRYNIPHLSHKYNVYALDLLGFGLSDKPLIDYSVEVWRDQVLSFLREVVIKDSSSTPCVVAGNSLGGLTALHAAASEEATTSNLISGCILLNAACTFRSPSLLPNIAVEHPRWFQRVAGSLQKLAIGWSFRYAQQPTRIAQVLRQIYPTDPEKVDADLVESIRVPSLHPNAPEVFHRVVVQNGSGPPVFADDLLAQLKVPLMLVWGSKVHFVVVCSHTHHLLISSAAF